MVSSHSLGAAIMESTIHAREVIDSIAEDAKTREVLCDLCLGIADDDTGTCYIVVDHPHGTGEKLHVECPKCGGTGKRRQQGDARAREIYLKLHRQLDEGPLVAFNTNTQLNVFNNHSESVARGQQLLERGRQLAAGSPQKAISAPATVIDLVPTGSERAKVPVAAPFASENANLTSQRGS